jgi:glycerol-3-phosphate dehydrogenase (NAD(P)+)
MKIAVIGAGAWGTAQAVALAKHQDVTLYARDARLIAVAQTARENPAYLPGVHLPKPLKLTANFSAVCEAELLVLAVPVASLRATCQALAGTCAQQLRQIVWLCKGFEEGTAYLPHQIVAEVLPGVSGAVLSGPSFAQEVAAGLPVALTAASPDELLAERITHALHGGAMRVYRSTDVIGVEVGGAVKNVMAIATGIADGLELGLNARAALITRGLSEMMRLGVALGGQTETLMGLTGVGDLILTCTGGLSRNRRVGLALGQGKNLDATLTELGHVAEGVRCAATVRKLADGLGVDMPITAAVCDVLFGGVPARQAVSLLLARAPRTEH